MEDSAVPKPKPPRPVRDAEKMRLLMWKVLFMDADQLKSEAAACQGKSAARVVAESLTLASMQGDLKAISLMMELAGADFRSRDSQEKLLLNRDKLAPSFPAAPVVFSEIRPE